eukprot:jgi/Chlat1/9125/Chrsp97S08387
MVPNTAGRPPTAPVPSVSTPRSALLSASSPGQQQAQQQQQQAHMMMQQQPTPPGGGAGRGGVNARTPPNAMGSPAASSPDLYIQHVNAARTPPMAPISAPLQGRSPGGLGAGGMVGVGGVGVGVGNVGVGVGVGGVGVGVGGVGQNVLQQQQSQQRAAAKRNSPGDTGMGRGYAQQKAPKR